jgi:hypothetical protein
MAASAHLIASLFRIDEKRAEKRGMVKLGVKKGRGGGSV